MLELPKLNYAYDALEPYLDAQTMEIHHSKHHQGYTNKTNAVLEKYPDLAGRSVKDLLTNIDSLDMSQADRNALRNNGGGYLNHKIFWDSMAPEKSIDDQLVADIESTFGSMDEFKKQFSEAAATQFGSGWAWLVRDKDNKLLVYSLPNQDSPYSIGHTPIFCLDVWEHAYYLKYQNRRPEFIEAWWNVLKLI